jgi:hypothetical protein
MSFLNSELVRTPGPEIKETDWAPGIRNWFQNLLSGPVKYPGVKIPGMGENEAKGQSILADILAGKSFEDPRTSPLYQGYRAESLAEEEKGVGDMRRFAQLGGMTRSTPAMTSEGRYRADMGNKRMTQLGGMYEAERARDNPYTRVAAAKEFGSLPREIETDQAKADYNQKLAELLAPYNLQAPIAETLMAEKPWYQPQFTQQPSGLQQLISMIGGLVMPMAGLWGKGPYAAPSSGGGGGGMNWGVGGGMLPFSLGGTS